jgi:hypothetical protein
MIVRIAFRYDDKRLFSRLVCLLRGGDSAHCEVAWKWDGLTHDCISASFLDGGVRQKVIPMPADKWRIYEIDAATLPGDWFRLNVGAGYDVLGLIGIVFPPANHAAQRWFCSEVAADILGLRDPQIFDLRNLEAVCARFGKRVQ